MSVSGNNHKPSEAVVCGGIYGSPKPFRGLVEPLCASGLGEVGGKCWFYGPFSCA